MAVVKYPNNNEGPLVLINEFVAYKIAEAMNINIPSCGLCTLNSDSNFGPEFQTQQELNNIITKDNYGICFCSSYIKMAIPFKPSFARMVCNIEDFQKIVLFDHIIYNKDRHEGNILLCTNDMKIYVYIIDHSHIFKNQCIWDRYSFSQGIEDNDYKDNDILIANQTIYNAFWKIKAFNKENALKQSQTIQSILTKDFIRDIIDSLPQPWCKEVNPKDLIALEGYINYRIIHLPDIINIISNH